MLRADQLIEKILHEDDNKDAGQSVRHTFGNEGGERGRQIAAAPSDRKTGTAEFHTKTGVKSDDEGETVEKCAIKDGKSAGAEDADAHRIAKSPSDNKTSAGAYRTKNAGSGDEGEGESKKAMKEDRTGEDIESLADQYLDAPPSE